MLLTAALTIHRSVLAAAAVLTLAAIALPGQAGAQVTAFKQAVAEGAARDDALAAFYRDNAYRAVWTGADAEFRERRQALMQAIAESEAHGLPPARYNPDELMRLMETARTPRDLGRVEVEMSRSFLRLARDMQTGMLVPSKIDSGIVREIPYRAPASYLDNFLRSNPRAFFRGLPPKSGEYARLMREKTRLERRLGAGGWGPKAPVASLAPGASGGAVIALRDRLTEMGYLERSASAVYDTRMQQAVQAFQAAHGLVPDGAAGAATIREINEPVEKRLASIMVAMERERWLNMPRGKRHILVNLTDFSARIIDDDKVTFRTRAVIGKNRSGQQSPEFSDEMEYLEINPTWNVPRSIAVKEYLPQMQRNPGAAGHLRLYNARGQQVSRAHINFNRYNARNFPFDLKQPPSPRNALGLVKFMFPNKYNIYLHDTPSKSLFQRNVRAFSHGCIRLQDPFDFAYALLARQESDPKAFFHSVLNTGRQTQVKLEKKVPVHLIYRTAFTQAKGPVQYRDDVYGRDARIWDAMRQAGVSLRAVQG
ncbi:murein L,D-transpeptidase [Roseovarius spongiae]|uniref:Murein L,D-transpeptidase n=1 Tax=Roseovarius spongiae TaxID=2320272 RepID=A0A3A8AXB5_9RHOB|nr:L,D-transpeptidase family protein [Roseovarius spongiae]RKF15460.1 murein L,D-transpeptidase [Roseovarius spongiae]